MRFSKVEINDKIQKVLWFDNPIILPRKHGKMRTFHSEVHPRPKLIYVLYSSVRLSIPFPPYQPCLNKMYLPFIFSIWKISLEIGSKKRSRVSSSEDNKNKQTKNHEIRVWSPWSPLSRQGNSGSINHVIFSRYQRY